VNAEMTFNFRSNAIRRDIISSFIRIHRLVT